MPRSTPGAIGNITISSADGAIIDGVTDTIKATVLDYTNSNPLAVRLTDTAGDYVSAGAGTQYTEGDTDATITGTALMWEDASDTLRAVSAAKPLPVDITNTTIAVTQSGTWNIGTLTTITNAVTVTATDLDIRNLTSTDVVTVTGGAGQTADVKITLDSESVAVTGTFWQATQPISAASLPLPTGASTEATLLTIDTDTGNIVTSVQTLDNIVLAEDTAHQTGDSGVMALAIRDDDPPAATSGTAGDYEPLHTDAVGRLWIHPVPTEADLATAVTAHVKKYYTSAGAVTDGIVWSPAAGKRWYVTDIFLNVSAAATVTIEDDLAAGDSAVWKAELAANSGWSHHFGTPLFSGEDAADLIVTTSAGNIYLTVCGYEV